MRFFAFSRTTSHTILIAFLATACSVEADAPPPGSTAGVANECAAAGAPTEHGGSIDADETWGAGTHHVTAPITLGPGVHLTLAPCAVVKLDPDTGITAGEAAGGIVAEGDAAHPIVLERADATAAWGSLAAFAPATLRLAHVTLRGGGTTTPERDAEYAGATLVGRDGQGGTIDTIAVDHVTIEGSNGLGVLLDGSGFAAGSTALTVRGAGTYPVYLGAGHATNLPPGAYAGNGVDAFLLQSVGPAVYDNAEPIVRDATLPNRGLPYVVGRDGAGSAILVGDSRAESPSATLTVEPGVELRFSRKSSAGQLRVRGKVVDGGWQPQGALVAEGTPDAPIVFTSQEPAPAPGDWAGLYFEYVVDPRTSLSNVRVAYAGGESLTTGLCVSEPGAPSYDADCSVVIFVETPVTRQFLVESRIESGLHCGVYRGWRGPVVDFAATNAFEGLTGCDQSNVAPADGGACTGGSCE